MSDIEKATEIISRAIVMDLWSLTDHTKVTRQEFLDAIARIQQQAQEREGEIARLREVLASIQWCSDAPDLDDGTIYQLCPICDQSEVRGHSPDCTIGALLTAEAKPEAPASHPAVLPTQQVRTMEEFMPESPAPVECACRVALAFARQNEAAANRERDAVVILLRAKTNDETWAAYPDSMQDAVEAEYAKLRAELAAANERAEEVKGLQARLDGAFDRNRDLRHTLDEVRAGWKEAVDIATEAMANLEDPDGDTFRRLRERYAANVVARFDAQVGKDAK